MVSTPELFTDDSPISPMTPTLVKKPSVRKSLNIFTDMLDMKKKTVICQFRASKSKIKAIKAGTMMWAMKKNEK